MAAFQFYVQSVKRRNVGWVEDDIYIVFRLKFPDEKGSVRRCFVVKVRAEVFAQSHAVAVKQNVTVVCGIDCLVYQEEFFVNNPLDIKDYDEHAFDFVLHLSRFFGLPCMPFKQQCTAHALFPECLCNQCQDLHRTFSEICTKFESVPLLDPLRNRITPDTLLQIKGRKKSGIRPSCLKLWDSASYIPHKK
jgi:hypothetical protein